MKDFLTLQVHDLEVQVLTGIYSQETHLPQPLRISIDVDLAMSEHFMPDGALSLSLNYMKLRDAATNLPVGVHFTLIEAVADHIIDTLLAADERVQRVTVKIVKLAIAEDGEAIGINMARSRK
jgi:7,8-dihydroneopterin aldolase/epimerase/oxygenase